MAPSPKAPNAKAANEKVTGEKAALHRGDIYWVDLGAVTAETGSAPAKRRPVLVVQADSYNRSTIATVMVAVVTSTVQTAELPGNVFVPAAASGLPRDSAVNVSHVLTLDRASLGERAGTLPTYLQGDVDRGLRLILGL